MLKNFKNDNIFLSAKFQFIVFQFVKVISNEPFFPLKALNPGVKLLENSLAAGDLSRSSRETTSLSLRISGIEGFAVVEGADSEPEEGSGSLFPASAILTNGC